MATTLSAAWPTLLDVARRMEPDGSIATVAEILNQYNEILDDIPWLEANTAFGHKMSLRGSIPTPTWRSFNQGVFPTKSTSSMVTESTGMMEGYAEIDRDEAELNGNTADWRLSEDKAFIEGFNETVGNTLFYGDVSLNPERFVGLAPRYWSINQSNTPTALNVFNAGGSTANNQTSIWLVVWGSDTAFGLYPKGTKAGLYQEDKGIQMHINTDGSQYEVYRTKYQWKCGLAVRDWRYVVRAANIDSTAILTASAKVGNANDVSADIITIMSKMLDMVPNLTIGQPVFYMNRWVRSALRTMLMGKSNMWLTQEDLQNGLNIPRPTLKYCGYPCRRCDQISSTEAVLS